MTSQSNQSPLDDAAKDPHNQPAHSLPNVGGRRIRGSINDFERACLVHIERLQYSLRDYDDSMMETFCEAVRLGREYSDAMNSGALISHPPATEPLAAAIDFLERCHEVAYGMTTVPTSELKTAIAAAKKSAADKQLIEQLLSVLVTPRQPWKTWCTCDYGWDGALPLQGELCDLHKLIQRARSLGYGLS